MTTTASGAARARAHVQRFGTFLSGMIMPNIGALIAWGLITAMFIQVGWTPVGKIGGFGTHMVDGTATPWLGLVGPTITYLLPILIAYQGGKMAYPDHETRGGVVGAVAVMGVIVGVQGSPMFIGAMIMGPLAGWTMKKLDSLWEGRIRPGFEMLVNNFSAGIWAAIVAIFGLYIVSPIVSWIMTILGNLVGFLVRHDLLPLASIFIEPAKVMFLNNAVNHGVLTPLGTAQVATAGKSILFMLEANPGPGMGVLLAYMFFGRGASKASAPGAAIIHFFGGIHEIYFPYVLMKPRLLAATILGGMTGVFLNVLFHNGLVGPAAPGSIIAFTLMAAKGDLIKIYIAILASIAVSFVISWLILKTDKTEEIDDGDLAAATMRMEEMKGRPSAASQHLVGAGVPSSEIHRIAFACDAGMGSSAMGASVLRNKIKEAGFGDVTVVNQAIANLKDEYQVVVTHKDLATRAAPKVPSATLLTVDNFMGSPRYDEVVEMIRAQRSVPVGAGVGASSSSAQIAAESDEEAEGYAGHASVLTTDTITLNGSARSKDDAIREAGQMLVEEGAVDNGYIAAMYDREKSVSTFMGNGLAIPHGTNEAKQFINRSAMSFVRYDQPIDWNGNPVRFVIGIAGKNKEHLTILGKIARIFSNTESVQALENARTEQEVLDILAKVNS
ncbi:MAG TPA: PTS mannitol transporter subunit IICBA [Propionibacteriaceae bacterium]|nr:PTS mannitol transporter subunit IICBA [Propionibacteriaceae bacterium]